MRFRPALLFILMAPGLIVAGCFEGPPPTATPDSVATETAIAFAVVSTLTAEAPPPTPTMPSAEIATSTPLPADLPTATATVAAASPVAPTATSPPPPTATVSPPTPTPTPPLFDVLPVDGEDGNLQIRGSENTGDGRYVVIPNVPPGSIAGDPPQFREGLAFLVEPFDPAIGSRSGDGIRQVNFTIINRDQGDVTVYTRTEQTVAYCAFGGGEPDCNVFIFNHNDFRWPNGPPLENANYRAVIEIIPQQSESATWNWDFALRDIPQPTQGEIVTEIVQIGWQSLDPIVTGDLVFQVRAYHTDYGASDGDGIDFVEMRILNAQGQTVHRNVEQNAAYCAFGGGNPQCNRLPLSQVGSGSYTLQATVHAVDGTTKSVETQITVP